MNMKKNHNVKVNVSSYFLEEHSDPVENTYLWAYKVKIRNIGLKTVCFRGGCITGPNHSGAKLHGFLSYLVKLTSLKKKYTLHG